MDKLCMFKLFGLGHFVYLFLSIGIVLGLIFTLKKLSEKGKMITNIVLFSSLFFFIILEFVGRIILIKDYNFFENLPLNYFQIFSVLMFVGFLRRNLKWIKFGYLISLPICFFSLIFIPKFYCDYSVFSVSLISYVFSNIAIISISLLNVLWEECEIEKRDILDVNMNFIIISSVIHILNVFFRFTVISIYANYGGTMGENYNHCIELLSTLIPVPFVFMIPIFAIVVGLTFLLRIPFDMMQHRKQKQSEIEELIALGNLKKQQEFRQKHAKTTSQIYVNSTTKAKPLEDKGVTNKTKTDFVSKHKEIQVNNSTTEK
jgi:hypothetical protein